MKKVLIILLTIVSNILYSQEFKGIEISKERKNQLLSVFEIPIQVKDGMMTLEEYNEYYVLIYLNNDTFIDLIFEGPSGGESNVVSIFLNSGQKFRLIKSELGRIKKINKSFPDSPVEILFNEYGCCDDPINFYQTWNLVNNEIIESEKYYFLDETKMPEDLGFQLIFKVKNSPYFLRATPEIINEKFHYHYEKGNIIAEFSEGDIGYVLNSTIDKTGRTWYFVAMNKPRKKGFHNYSVFWNQKWLGWMSSRFVEIID